jgi:hypothetical protein
VIEIAGSAFADTGITSLAVPGFSMRGSFLFRMGAIVCCLGSPRSIRIPASVLEIGGGAFWRLNSLVELSFEEGVNRIGPFAFWNCPLIRKIAFPTSLVVIDESAFDECESLCEITFAAGSHLQCIRKQAFSCSPLTHIVLPASVSEIDPYAFAGDGWPIVAFDDPPPFLVRADFVCSADSKTILVFLSDADFIVIPARVELIGSRASIFCGLEQISFESESRLREIGEDAFSRCYSVTEVTIPSSVEILGDRCFKGCYKMATISFVENSKLKKIGERAFAGCGMISITIPASTEEIDGSAFVGCPLEAIEVAPGSRNFMIEGNLLLTSNGTQIVRYFGRECEVLVPNTVEVLRKSCFESSNFLEAVVFESGSKLIAVGSFAVSQCESLTSIIIPTSVEIIEESAFKDCCGLDYCLFDESSVLVSIGKEAFAGCLSLRSFDIPGGVKTIGQNCFSGCSCLHQFGFQSVDSLKQVVRDKSLDKVLEDLGFTDISIEFQIKVDSRRVDLTFRGWLLVTDEDFHLMCV